MNILFLGYEDCKLINFLYRNYNVLQTQNKICLEDCNNIDFIISFGYKHIIKEDIISSFDQKIINLHISYLPYNRGYHPNFWSFKDNTPKGVTIHLIDKGVDTGDILLQKEIKFDKNEDTLSLTYNRLIEEIQNLFIDNCDLLLNDKILPISQNGKGSFHYQKDLAQYEHLLTEGWDTKICNIVNKKG